MIGAGLAGLAAAYHLTQKRWNVQLLEATGRLGGRVMTHHFKRAPGLVCELGGEWIGKDHHEMQRLCCAFDLEFQPHQYSNSVWNQRKRARLMATKTARGANRFFGFAHATYGSAHVTIGYPTLTLGGTTWRDRPLTWHGNNMMERINLPTRAQGGFDYRNTAVLFRRNLGGFEINVFPWHDDAAVAWRAASHAIGTVFRLGERGRRICGLF